MNTNVKMFHGVRMTSREIDIQDAATLDERKKIADYLHKYAAEIMPKNDKIENQEEATDAVFSGMVKALAESIEEGGHS